MIILSLNIKIPQNFSLRDIFNRHLLGNQLLQRERHRFGVQLFEERDKRRKRFSAVVPVRAENAGKALPAVERDPGKLAAVIVQETRSKAHAALRRDVGARRIVIGAVEVIDVPGTDQAVLDRSQRLRRTASHHQRPSIQILFFHQVLFCQRIVFICDQIDPAFEQVVDFYARDLFCLFL